MLHLNRPLTHVRGRLLFQNAYIVPTSSDFTVFPSWSRTSKDGILSPIFSILSFVFFRYQSFKFFTKPFPCQFALLLTRL